MNLLLEGPCVRVHITTNQIELLLLEVLEMHNIENR